MLRELPLSYYDLEDDSDFARWLDECQCELCGRSHEEIEMCEDEPEAWKEYDGAAKSFACKGLKGESGDPLPEGMSVEAVRLINADPEAFQQRVRETAYAIAMNRVA